MTVSTTTNKVAYIGNGIATTFAIPFPFLEKTHLKVYQLLNNVQTDRTDWTISGGNMVFATAPANDAQIVIMREVPLTQETDYRENEVLPAETLERNFDKLTMQVQQLKEQADRAVTVDVFDDTDAASLIPSIRQSVSDCAGYVETATQKAQNALASAASAAEQAEIAAQKTREASAILNNKANKDMDDLSAVRKKTVAHLAMPGNQHIDLTPGSSNTNYTAPADGFFTVSFSASAAGFVNLAVSTTGLLYTGSVPAASGAFGMSIPVKQGDVLNVWYSTALTLNRIRFIYAQGAN